PDQYPDVEQHDRAQPGAYADGVKARVLEQERAQEILAEQHRSRQPRHDGGPAEPEERARGDVLGDARAGAVLTRLGKRGNLHEVEVVEQPYPHYPGPDVKPAANPELYEVHHDLCPLPSMHCELYDVEKYDDQDEAADNRSPKRVERIFHSDSSTW